MDGAYSLRHGPPLKPNINSLDSTPHGTHDHIDHTQLCIRGHQSLDLAVEKE